ncbi:MAG TPA: hypothetical protein VFP78_15995 [Solirubrobacteraceae bacterium]|nr:hypothetical protein [Solirubrobacteraceae bacterium]
MTARLAVLVALVASIVGCGGEETAPEPAATPDPAVETEAAEPSGANAFIGSMAVDPVAGTLLLGTGVGLFRLEAGEERPRRVVGELRAPEGAGPVSRNLVVRYWPRASPTRPPRRIRSRP